MHKTTGMAFQGLQSASMKQEYHISNFRIQVKNEIVVNTKFAQTLLQLSLVNHAEFS